MPNNYHYLVQSGALSEAQNGLEQLSQLPPLVNFVNEQQARVEKYEGKKKGLVSYLKELEAQKRELERQIKQRREAVNKAGANVERAKGNLQAAEEELKEKKKTIREVLCAIDKVDVFNKAVLAQIERHQEPEITAVNRRAKVRLFKRVIGFLIAAIVVSVVTYFLDAYVFSGLMGVFAGGGALALLATFFYGIQQARKESDFTILASFIGVAIVIALLEYQTNFFSSIMPFQLTNITRTVFLEPMWIGFLITVGVVFVGIAAYICRAAYKAYMKKGTAQKPELEDVLPEGYPLLRGPSAQGDDGLEYQLQRFLEQYEEGNQLNENNFIGRSVGPYFHAGRGDDMDGQRYGACSHTSDFFSIYKALAKNGLPPSTSVYNGQRHGPLTIILDPFSTDEKKSDDEPYGVVPADLPQISSAQPILQTEAEQTLQRARASFWKAVQSGDHSQIDSTEIAFKNALKIVMEAKNLNAALLQEEAQASAAPAISSMSNGF